MLADLKKISLSDLARYKTDLEKSLVESGGEVPDEVHELVEVAGLLLSGKVDQAANFKVALESGIEAAKAQVAYLTDMLEETKRLMKEAVEATAEKRIDGTSFALRIQNNSRGSTTIENEALVPNSFKRVTITHTFPFDQSEIDYWTGALLKRVLTEDRTMSVEEAEIARTSIRVETSKSAVEEVYKKGGEVAGCRYEKGTHLRVEAGKARPRITKG